MDRTINVWRWLNSGAFVAMVAINILANVLPIGAGTTGFISDLYPTQITPAPFVFFIWTLIYIMMAVFVIYQWNYRGREMVVAIGPWFAISCILNIAWILTWHHLLMWISVLAIVGLLVSLSMIRASLDNGQLFGFGSKAILISFDLYTGWITAATILNISSALVFSNWNRFGLSDMVWTGIILFAGAIIGSLPTILKRRYTSTLAVIWAYFGIMIKQVNASQYTIQETNAFSLSAIGMVLMIFTILFMVLSQKTGRSYCRLGIREDNLLEENDIPDEDIYY